MAERELQLKIALARAGLSQDAAGAAATIQSALQGIEAQVGVDQEKLRAELAAVEAFTRGAFDEIPVGFSVDAGGRLRNDVGQFVEVTRRQIEVGLQGIEIDLDLDAGNIRQADRALSELADETVNTARQAKFLKEAYNLNDREIDQVIGKIQQLEAETKQARQEALNLAGIFGGTLAAGVGAVFGSGLQGFAQFEQFQTILTNTLGSAAEAEKALAQIEQFASTTPFQLDEVVEGFIKLQNRGIKPTNDVLRQLGDLASSQGKSLDQVVEAVLDAQTGEFERLKEFGITAKTSGDQVTLAFKGVEQTVAKTPEALSAAVIELGALEGVAGQMAAQSEILVGSFSNLQDEAGKATRVFGEFAAAGARPVIDASIALLQTFNALPAPIQATLIASTAFVGILGASVAAIAAYNVANGQRVTQEIAAAAATVKGNAALVAKNTATAIATTAQSLYAAATGQATAAQLAQNAALGAGALKLGLFAGAAASIALVVDTYRQTTEAGRETAAATREVEKSLLELQKTSGDTSPIIGEETSSNAKEAIRNVEQLTESLGPTQNALDKVRSLVDFIPGVATAAEAASNRSQVAFGELTQAAGEVEGEAVNLQLALKQGLEVDPSTVGATVASINTAIDALKAQNLVTKEEIRLRDEQVGRLEQYRDAIEQATGVSGDLTDATDALSSKLKNLATDLDNATAALDGQAKAQEARIKELLANGQLTQQEADSQLAQVEQQNLQDRISAATKQVAELQRIKAATTDPEELAEVNQQILEVENQLNQDRITLAQNATDRQKELADDAKEAQKELADDAKEAQKEAAEAALDAVKEANAQADAAIVQSQQTRVQAIREAQRDGKISAEQAAADIIDIELDVIDRTIKAREAELARFRNLKAQGSLTAQEFAEKEREINAEIGELNLERVNQEIAGQEQIRQAQEAAAKEAEAARDDQIDQIKEQADAQEALATVALEAEESRIKAADRVAEAYDRQAQLIDSQLKLFQAQADLQSSLFDARESRLDQIINSEESSEAEREKAARELIKLTEERAAAEKRQLEQRQALERQQLENQQRAAALADQRAIKEEQFALKKLELQRLELENELRIAQIEGDPQAIAIAQAKLAALGEQAALQQEIIASRQADAQLNADTRRDDRRALLTQQEQQDVELAGQQANDARQLAGQFEDMSRVDILAERLAALADANLGAETAQASSFLFDSAAGPLPGFEMNPAVQLPNAAFAAAPSPTMGSEFATPIVEEIRKLNANLEAVANSPRSISLSTPSPYQDLSRVLGAIADQQTAGVNA